MKLFFKVNNFYLLFCLDFTNNLFNKESGVVNRRLMVLSKLLRNCEVVNGEGAGAKVLHTDHQSL